MLQWKRLSEKETENGSFMGARRPRILTVAGANKSTVVLVGRCRRVSESVSQSRRVLGSRVKVGVNCQGYCLVLYWYLLGVGGTRTVLRESLSSAHT